MAKVSKLIPCPTCGKTISENAVKCPHCGAKNKAKKKSPVPKIILAVLALFIVVGVVGTMLGGDKDDGKKKADDKSGTAAKTGAVDSGEEDTTPQEKEPSAPAGKMIGSGDLGDYHVEINSAFLVKDYGEHPAIVVNYSWTNNSDETTSATVAVHEKAFQDGVQIDPAFLINVEGYDAGTSLKEVRPGTTIDVQCAFELTSDTSIVEFEISELISLSKDMVTMDFDPTSLG